MSTLEMFDSRGGVLFLRPPGCRVGTLHPLRPGAEEEVLLLLQTQTHTCTF